MSVDEICERTTIHFERQVELPELRELFGYLALRLQADIQYNVKTTEVARGRNSASEQEPTMLDQRVQGNIFASRVAGVATFDCLTDPADYRIITGLKFCPIPGYDVSEHNKDVVKLWDTTKSLAKLYFYDH